MPQNKLNLLSSSYSLVFILLMANPASASTIASTTLTGITAPKLATVVGKNIVAAQTKIIAAARSNPRNITVDPDSDTVGDLAIAKFKCDCPPCRIAVVQMLQTGQLSL
jgi:hypothetical protein